MAKPVTTYGLYSKPPEHSGQDISSKDQKSIFKANLLRLMHEIWQEILHENIRHLISDIHKRVLALKKMQRGYLLDIK